MAFHHSLVNRIAWVVSAAAAVLLVVREVRERREAEEAAAWEASETESWEWVGGTTARAQPARPVQPVAPVPPLGPRVGHDSFDKNQVLVALTGVTDDEVRSEGFTLKVPMRVHVYALGEGTGGQMHDYGTILDATTRRPVWIMDYDRTGHAGGAEKNRLAEDVVELAPGGYIVRYITDDSHAYGDWNASAPDDEASWGITLYCEDGPLDRDAVGPYEEREDPNLIARLVEVGDDEFRQQRFTLDAATDLEVYAIGEGIPDDKMYDYAWIQRAGGAEVVWQMRLENTQPAGGDRKNRLFDGVIRLPAGTYTLVYISDGSHSFGDWNTSPPIDQFNWGVTLRRR